MVHPLQSCSESSRDHAYVRVDCADQLHAPFASDDNCVAAVLVGSYAQGRGDRISDLGVFTQPGQASNVLDKAHAILSKGDVL